MAVNLGKGFPGSWCILEDASSSVIQLLSDKKQELFLRISLCSHSSQSQLTGRKQHSVPSHYSTLQSIKQHPEITSLAEHKMFLHQSSWLRVQPALLLCDRVTQHVLGVTRKDAVSSWRWESHIQPRATHKSSKAPLDIRSVAPCTVQKSGFGDSDRTTSHQLPGRCLFGSKSHKLCLAFWDILLTVIPRSVTSAL